MTNKDRVGMFFVWTCLCIIGALADAAFFNGSLALARDFIPLIYGAAGILILQAIDERRPCSKCHGTRRVMPTGQMAESEAGLMSIPCDRCR